MYCLPRTWKKIKATSRLEKLADVRLRHVVSHHVSRSAYLSVFEII